MQFLQDRDDSETETRPAARGRIVVFGFDVAEVSQIRRIRALRAAGYAVQSFTMRRDNMNADFEPDWSNTHLFNTRNEQALRRVAVIAGSIAKMTQHRASLRHADMILARNLDMLLIAATARRMAGATGVPLVYECLDIHGMMTGSGAKSHLARKVERRLLADCALLVVSSPGFIREYFEPVQGYAGPWELWENKLFPGPGFPNRPARSDRSGSSKGNAGATAREPGAKRRLQLGWIGTIRCAPSMALLAETARRMQDRLDLHVHGVVHLHVLPGFDEFVAAHPNVHYYGPYSYPADLPEVYGDCDIVWAQDLWQRGANSDWLLPNRIYEAPWCGCLCVAVRNTETGRRVARDRLGPVIDRPDADALVACLDTLTPEWVDAWAQELLNRPEADVVQTADDLHRVVSRALGTRST